VSFIAPFLLILYNRKCIIGCKNETKRSKMKKSNKVMTAVMIIVVLAAVFLAFSSGFPYADRDLPVGREAEQQRSLNDNLPDAVSSYYDGTTCRLKVVANRSQIDNGERFAE